MRKRGNEEIKGEFRDFSAKPLYRSLMLKGAKENATRRRLTSGRDVV